MAELWVALLLLASFAVVVAVSQFAVFFVRRSVDSNAWAEPVRANRPPPLAYISPLYALLFALAVYLAAFIVQTRISSGAVAADNARTWSAAFFSLAAYASVFAIVQSIFAARWKRAAAYQAQTKPAKPPEPVPAENQPPPEVPAPPPQPYRESLEHFVFAGWAPFYTFLFAVAMFAFGYIAHTQIPTPSVAVATVWLYQPTPTPTPTRAPATTAAPTPRPTRTPKSTSKPTGTPTLKPARTAKPTRTGTPTPETTRSPKPRRTPTSLLTKVLAGRGAAASSVTGSPAAAPTATGTPKPTPTATPSPTPTPTPSPTPVPTAAAISCSSTLTADNGTITAGGSDFVTLDITCGGVALKPTAAPSIATMAGASPTPMPIAAPADGAVGKTFHWGWIVSAPAPTASPTATLGGGVTTVVYVGVTPAGGNAYGKQGVATTITLRDRTTIDGLTTWVQGLAGFFAAVLALIAGIRNFARTGENANK